MRTDWILVALLFVAGLLAAAQFGKISLALPYVAEAYGRDTTVVAPLVSVVGVTGVVAGAVAGGLVAALGARRVVLAALGLGAVAAAVQALMPPLPVLVLVRIVEGVSHLGIVVAAPTLMAGTATDRDRPMVMAIWAMFFGVSFAVLALAMPAILSAGGLPLLFGLHGAALAVMIPPLAWRLAPQPRSALRLAPLAVHARIYGAPRRAAPGVIFVFYSVMFVALVTFVPGAMDWAALATLLPLLNLAGTFAAGRAARWTTPGGLMTAGFLGSGLCAVALAAGATLAILPLFFCLGVVPGAAFAAIPHWNATQEDRALSTGGVAQMGNVGTTLGTPIFSALLAVGGPDGLWAGIGLFAAAGITAVLVTGRAIRRAAPAPPSVQA